MSAVTSIQTIVQEGVTMLKIPPSWVGIEMDTVVGRNVATRPETGAQVAQRMQVAALICGPMFEIASGQPRSYPAYNEARLLYLYKDLSRGIDIPTVFPARGSTISVSNGVASHARGAVVAPGATFAIQGYPSMIQRGQNVSSTRLDLNAVGRACVGIHQDGSIVFAIGTMGIRPFSDKLIRLGVAEATYMDGGGSTELLGPATQIGLGRRRLPAYIIAAAPGAVTTIGYVPPEVDTDYDDPNVVGSEATDRPMEDINYVAIHGSLPPPPEKSLMEVVSENPGLSLGVVGMFLAIGVGGYMILRSTSANRGQNISDFGEVGV